MFSPDSTFKQLITDILKEFYEEDFIYYYYYSSIIIA